MSSYRPTPTQAENDAAALGNPVIQKEHDGSPLERQESAQEPQAYEPPPSEPPAEKAYEAEHSHPHRGYRTRRLAAEQGTDDERGVD